MRFTLDSTSAINVVRAYSPDGFQINDRTIAGTVIVSASELAEEPGLRGIADLTAAVVSRIMTMDPEVVLLGTGPRQQFPEAAFGAQFMRAGIGFEVMDSGAACRTFNVLVAEKRRAVAVLLP